MDAQINHYDAVRRYDRQIVGRHGGVLCPTSMAVVELLLTMGIVHRWPLAAGWADIPDLSPCASR
jgi:hypothetical protein